KQHKLVSQWQALQQDFQRVRRRQGSVAVVSGRVQMADNSFQQEGAQVDDELALRLVIELSQLLEIVGAKQPQALLPHLFLALFITGRCVDTEEAEHDGGVGGDERLPGPAAALLTPGEGLVKCQQDQLYLRCASRRLSPR